MSPGDDRGAVVGFSSFPVTMTRTGMALGKATGTFLEPQVQHIGKIVRSYQTEGRRAETQCRGQQEPPTGTEGLWAN